MTILLPKEIMLAIFEEVDEPRDLLSLALCRRSFKRIIIPRHLCFRHIRHDHKKASLWKYLVDRPVIAARLRKLEVVDVSLTGSNGQLMPSSLPARKRFPSYSSPSPDEVQDLIYEMLPLLVRLQRFVWMERAHPAVLAKLHESSMLQELHLSLWLPDHHTLAGSGSLPLNKSTTWNLRSVAIKVAAVSESSRWPEIRTLENNIQTLLNHSPLLEDLYLLFSWRPYPMIEDLLKNCQWPFLQRFTLGYYSLVDTPTAVSPTTLARFFRSHPTLHSVAFLNIAQLHAGSITPDVLPGLKTLTLLRWDTVLADILPVEVARRLVNYHGILQLEEGGRCSQLLSQMSNLETCNITTIVPNGRILGDAIRGLSHLTRLFYQTPFTWYNAERFTDDNQEPIPELPTLLTLKSLVHLSGPALHNLSSEDPRTTVLDLLAKNLPDLLFVRASFYEVVKMSWLKIARIPQETTTTCHAELASEAQFKFIPTDHHEYPVETDPGRWAYFKGFDVFQTSRRSDFWT